MVIAIIISGVVLAICSVHIVRLKSDIRDINKNLNIVKVSDTNMLLTSTTFDKDICNLIISVNDVLEHHREVVIQNERTNRDFKQVITNISHDLRTPLTSIMGYIQIVNLNIPNEPVYCLCDSKVLERIVCNLIQNALVHGIDFFELTVDSKECAAVFKNKVKSIGEIDITRLFDRFYTADLSRNAKTTGLGLAIAKELIKSIDGEISALADDDTLGICIRLKQIL